MNRRGGKGRIWPLAVTGVLLVLAAGWWLPWHRPPPSPWHPATVPYNAKCGEKCRKNLDVLADDGGET